jgi:hypothetical protein
MVNVLSRHRAALAALLALPLWFFSSVAAAQDFTRIDRSIARSWGLYRIAEIQAEQGDITGALNTIASIDDLSVVRGTWDSNGASIGSGIPLYDHARPSSSRPSVTIFDGRRAVDRLPATVPEGLPKNYLAADPRHGRVANFTDEHDSNGKRVTCRRYADGYTVIETPRGK